MIRRMVVMALLAMPMSVLALGLGDINVRSGLNQPLEAEIPLLSVASDEIDTLNVGLASPEAFEQAGVERPFHLTQLRFKVEQRGGKSFIHAYSQEPVKEPYLQYLLEVNWRGGRLVKEFTVLLDPPTLAEVAPPPIRAPKVAVVAPPAAAPPPVSATPVEPAPSPAQKAPTETSSPATKAPQSTTPPVSEPRASEPREDYTVKPGETLWAIAQKLQPDDTVSAQQIMLAILKQNPAAFSNSNVNNLKAHAVLTVPDFDAIIALSKDEAKGIVKGHNADWKGASQKPAVAEAKPAESQTNSVPEPEAGAKLKLVAPTEEVKPAAPAAVAGTPATGSPSPPAATTNTPSTATTASPVPASTPSPSAATPTATSATDTAAVQAAELDRAHKELTLANEAVEARRQENDEMRSRLAALEEQTASTQRLIKLKDEELATLQAKMKEIEQGQPSSATKPAANADTGAAQPQPNADESSLAAMWSVLIGNPLGQGMVAALGLLLVSMLWLVKRRNEASAFVAEESVGPVVAAQGFTSASPVLAATAPAPEETDPLDEADAYIHHQRYAQAEAVLKQAIADDPERHELRLKLLEMYSRTKDVAAFTTQARELHDSLHGHGGPLWDKVVDMGKELDPNEALFGGQPPVVTGLAGATGFAANETLEIPPSAPGAFQTSHVIEFDQASPAPPAMEQAASTAGRPEPDVLESFPTPTESSPLRPFEPQPSPEQSPAWSFDTTQDKGRDYPLDLDLEKEAERLADAGVESAPLPETGRPAFLESSEPTAEDEVATKLDLARAYMDMGDPDGAQGILDEVMKEGNEAQRQEAEELLRKIG